ncbi:hypothetical protein EV363DRAFT_1291996 [Boletus edulis]|nr:hypothetical protein EV363DRAFT_1291996 [Boletus edulis]
MGTGPDSCKMFQIRSPWVETSNMRSCRMVQTAEPQSHAFAARVAFRISHSIDMRDDLSSSSLAPLSCWYRYHRLANLNNIHLVVVNEMSRKHKVTVGIIEISVGKVVERDILVDHPTSLGGEMSPWRHGATNSKCSKSKPLQWAKDGGRANPFGGGFNGQYLGQLHLRTTIRRSALRVTLAKGENVNPSRSANNPITEGNPGDKND